MKIHAIACVPASEVFWGCDEALEWFTSYSELTWGGSCHTLVSMSQIERRLLNRVSPEEKEVYDQAQIVMERLTNLPIGVLIDMEN
jgi:hypothetical protein